MGLLVPRVPAGRPRSNLAADLSPLRLAARSGRASTPRREDRLHGRPDRAHARRLRAAGGRAAADDAARRHHRRPPAHRRRRWTGVRRCARSRSRSTRAPGAIEVEGTRGRTAPAPHGRRRPRAAARRRASSPSRPRSRLNLSRRLAAAGLAPGKHHRDLRVRSRHPAQRAHDHRRPGARGRARGRPARARVQGAHAASAGITSTSWITDTGEVVREESPLGLIVVKETPRAGHRPGRARPGAGPTCWRRPRSCPSPPRRIDDPGRRGAAARAPRRRRPLRAPTCRAPGQTVDGRRRSRCATRETLQPGSRRDPTPRRLPAPGAVHRERRPRDRGRGAEGAWRAPPAPRARRGAAGAPRERPPREEADGEPALRAARCCARGSATATSTPRSTWPWRARWACRRGSRSGLVYLRGGFYYHAWPEVYVEEGAGAGCGCPSTPRSTSSPPTPPTSAWPAAASTARRSSCPLIGRAQDDASSTSRLTAGSTPRPGRAAPAQDLRPLELPHPQARQRTRLLVAALADADDRGRGAGQAVRAVHRRGRRRASTWRRARSTASWARTARARRPPSASSRACSSRPRAAIDDQRPRPRRRSRRRPRRRSASSPTGRSSTRSSPRGEFLRFHGGLYGMDGDGVERARGARCWSCSS